MSRLPLPWRIVGNAAASLVLAFLVLPIFAVVPASINKASYIRIPPTTYSTDWYVRFLDDPEWKSALSHSVEIATLSSLLAVVVGTLAAIGLRRVGRRARATLTGLFLAPMTVPVVVTAVAMYRSALDVGLSGTLLGLCIAHAVLAVPFVVINVSVSLRGVNESWLRAADGLGAGPWTIFRTVILPNILPGIVGGAVFSFISSFDEVVVAVFLAGYSSKTLPVKIWESIRLEFTPTVAVAATAMIGLALVLFVLAQAVTRRNAPGRA